MLKKLLSNKNKNYIKYFLSKNNHSYDQYKNKKKIVVCLGADYGNLGDVAITISQIDFLKKTFPNYEVFEFPISKTFADMKSLESIISSSDIITLTGGGNTSIRYNDIEICRQFIIKKFRKNKIIAFPQSIDTHYNKKFINNMKKVYYTHPNLFYFVREEYSYKFIKEHLPKLNCFMAPDIVLSNVPLVNENSNKNNIIISLRGDKERLLTEEQKNSIISEVSKNGNVIYADTQIKGDFNFTLIQRKKILNDFLKQYQSAKLVITDRLHGMIFSYISNTPCIVFSCDNKKIKGVHSFLTKSNKIIYSDTFDINSLKNDISILLYGNQDVNNPVDFKSFQNQLKEIVK